MILQLDNKYPAWKEVYPFSPRAPISDFTLGDGIFPTKKAGKAQVDTEGR